MVTREFSLQPVLTYKERLEDLCQMALAEIEAAVAREHRALELLFEMQRLGYQELEGHHRSGQMDIGAISVSFGDLQALENQIERQLATLTHLTSKAQQKRAELLEISKEKKALEKLKEKHTRHIAKAMAREENKAIDEIATSQFHRRKKSEQE